jgi:hypothetical protein
MPGDRVFSAKIFSRNSNFSFAVASWTTTSLSSIGILTKTSMKAWKEMKVLAG